MSILGASRHQCQVRVTLVTGNELLLLGTVLCHEMGHLAVEWWESVDMRMSKMGRDGYI